MNVVSVDRAGQESPEQLGRHDGCEAPDDVRDLAVEHRQRPAPGPCPELSVAVVGRVYQGGEGHREDRGDLLCGEAELEAGVVVDLPHHGGGRVLPVLAGGQGRHLTPNIHRGGRNAKLLLSLSRYQAEFYLSELTEQREIDT